MRCSRVLLILKLSLFIAFLFDTRLLQSQIHLIRHSITGSDTTVVIDAGGKIDASNTRRYSTHSIVYHNPLFYQGYPLNYYNTRSGIQGIENNYSFSLENTSSETIVNPQIEINGKGFVYQFSDWLKRLDLHGLGTRDDSLKAVWGFLTNEMFHWVTSTNEQSWLINPLRTYNVYGAGQCDQLAQILSSILKYLGYSGTNSGGIGHDPNTRLPSHAVTLIHTDKGIIPLDPDLNVFYTLRDNKALATIEEIWNDQDIARRQRTNGLVLFGETDWDDRFSAVYSRQGLLREYNRNVIDTFGLKIRPSEKFIFTWNDFTGLYQYYHVNNDVFAPPPTISYGYQIYQPLTKHALPRAFVSQSNLSVDSTSDHVQIYSTVNSNISYFTIENSNPYSLLDGYVKFNILRSDTNSGLSIYFQKDTLQSPILIYTLDSNLFGLISDSVRLYNFISPVGTPITNKYFIHLEWNSVLDKGLIIDSLSLSSVFQLNPASLPRLNAGINTVRISNDDNKAFNGLVYEHSFFSIDSIEVPPIIDSPIFPLDGGITNSSKFLFQFGLPSGMNLFEISDFHIQVSEDSLFRFPVSSHYNQMTSQYNVHGTTNQFEVPHEGLLSPNTTYYWRVATRSKDGVYSDWSPAWRFQVQIPDVVKNLRLAASTNGINILWDINSSGSLPTKYYIYGSNIRGFSVSDQTLIDSTDTNRFTISDYLKKLSFSFYRVISVDDNGNKSGPSDLIGLENVGVLFNNEISFDYSDSIKIQLRPITLIDRWGSQQGYRQFEYLDSVKISPISFPKTMSFTDSAITGYAKLWRDTSIEFRVTSSKLDTVYHIKLNPTFPSNRTPFFGAVPDSNLYEDSLYQCKITVADSDSVYGDTTILELLFKPSWMTFDPASMIVYGTPTAYNVGDTSFSMLVTDLQGATNVQTQSIRVHHTNHAPIFGSIPVQTAKEDSQFVIRIYAHDVDSMFFGDELRYFMLNGPSWLIIDSVTGYLTGIPDAYDAGENHVVVEAYDQKGGRDSLVFSINVLHTNHPPVFVSNPDTIALEDEVYNYTAYAYDQDSLLFNDKIKYRLVIGPHWLTMDSISGVLQGIPDGYSVGDTTVLLEATDGFVTIQQSFELKIVHVNHAPIFLSSTDSVAKVDSLYRFQLYAFDKDSFLFNDILRYRLFDGPDWMTIDSVSGVIIGVPSESDIGKHLVIAEAYDRNGSSSEVEWAVTVGRAFRPPTAFALENPTHQDTLTLFKTPLMRTFTWSKANDPDSQDTLLYHFRIYGPGLDTVFHGIKDTNVTFSGIVFQENSKYYWTVKVFDGMFTVSSIDTFYFHTTKRFSNQTFEELPKSFELFQNYPNPFNPNTILRFQVPEESEVILDIYNILGQKVQRIYKGRLPAKYFEIDWKAEGKASGIYIIRMEAIGKISGRRYIKSRRILLLK